MKVTALCVILGVESAHGAAFCEVLWNNGS